MSSTPKPARTSTEIDREERKMSRGFDRRTLAALRLIAVSFCKTFLCLGQQVTLPVCPQFAGNPQLSASCITNVADLAFDSAGTGWIADYTGYTPGRVLRFPGIMVGQVPNPNQAAD